MQLPPRAPNLVWNQFLPCACMTSPGNALHHHSGPPRDAPEAWCSDSVWPWSALGLAGGSRTQTLLFLAVPTLPLAPQPPGQLCLYFHSLRFLPEHHGRTWLCLCRLIQKNKSNLVTLPLTVEANSYPDNLFHYSLQQNYKKRNAFWRPFILFWPHHAACGLLVPRPGIELSPPAVEM